MLEEELLSVLALQKAKGIGDVIAKKLIRHCGSAQNVFLEKQRVLEGINGIGTHTIKNLFQKEYRINAETELKYISENNIKTVYYLDEYYPNNLKHCIDAPILMFCDGKIDIQEHPIISIVGTRNMTLYGRDFIIDLIQKIAPYKPTIVSGFAYGVDITAQKEAIKHQLQTIGVLAHGLNHIYPKAHKKYVSKVNDNGGFFTEFWHNETPLRENFLKRNRIVAGLSEATIIIESASKGGSLVTADIANSYDRDVFAVPGKTTDQLSSGCNDLIKRNKAAILTSADDLIEALNWDLKDKQEKVVQRSLFVNLDKEEQLIYDFLFQNGKQHIDTISLDCKIPVYKLASLLFNLEMKGVLKPLQGKYFQSI